MVVSDTGDVPAPHKESSELGEHEQPTAQVEAEVFILLTLAVRMQV